MTTVPITLLASAGVGFAHAVLPDHWAPLAVLARTRGYPLRRVVRQSLAAAVTHVLLSLVLGAVVIVVGLRLRGTVEHHQDLIVGTILLGTGVAFLLLEFFGKKHDHHHEHEHEQEHHGGIAALVVPFGAAASPDLTILPIFVAASTLGTGAAVGSLTVFAIATIATFTGLTVAATLGARLLTAPWVERRANLLTATTLLVVGGLVITGTV